MWCNGNCAQSLDRVPGNSNWHFYSIADSRKFVWQFIHSEIVFESTLSTRPLLCIYTISSERVQARETPLHDIVIARVFVCILCMHDTHKRIGHVPETITCTADILPWSEKSRRRRKWQHVKCICTGTRRFTTPIKPYIQCSVESWNVRGVCVCVVYTSIDIHIIRTLLFDRNEEVKCCKNIRCMLLSWPEFRSTHFLLILFIRSFVRSFISFVFFSFAFCFDFAISSIACVCVYEIWVSDRMHAYCIYMNCSSISVSMRLRMLNWTCCFFLSSSLSSFFPSSFFLRSLLLHFTTSGCY